MQDHATPPLRREPIAQAFRQELSRRSPRGVALVGPPWSGGTLLGSHLVSIANGAGWQTLTLRAAPGLRDIPFGALAPLLGSPARTRTDVTTDLTTDLTGLGRAREAITDRLEAGPLALMIDDAQWLDDLTAAVLSQLVLDSLVPILVVSIAEPDSLPPGTRALLRDRAIVRHDLEPLDGQAIRRVIDTTAGGEVDPLTKHAIVTRSNGLPALAAELTWEAVRTGALRPDGAVLRHRGELRIPPAVAERVTTDLADLPAEVLHVVEVLAVTGQLPRSIAAAVAGDASLVEAGRLGLVDLRMDDQNHTVALRNPLIGDVVRQRLPPIAQVEVARTVSKQLLAQPNGREHDPLLFGSLALIAGEEIDPDEAVAWAIRANTLGRVHLALRFATAAAEQRPDDPGITCQLAEVLMLEGRNHEAEQFLVALRPDRDDDLALVAMTRAINLFHYLDETELAGQVMADAIERLTGTQWEAELRGLAAVFTLFLGYPADAVDQVRPHLADAQGRNLVEAITAAAPALVMAGRPEEAATLAQRGFEERLALGDQPALSNAGIHLVARSLALGEAGHLGEAVDLAALVRTGAEAEQDRDGMLWIGLVGGRALLTMGRLDDADEWFRTANGLATELGLRTQRRWALAGIVLSLAMQGRESEMRLTLLDLENAARPVARLMESEADRAIAWAHAVTGNLTAARHHLCQAADQAIETGQDLIALVALHDAVRLDLALPLDDLASVAARVEGPLARARLRHGAAIATGDASELAAAAGDFEILGADLLAAEATMQAAALASRGGDQRGAERLRHRAEQIQARCQRAATPALAWNDRSGTLTRREREVALLAAGGTASKEIALHFGISVRTVNNLLQRVYRKLGVHRRSELAAELTRRDPT